MSKGGTEALRMERKISAAWGGVHEGGGRAGSIKQGEVHSCTRDSMLVLCSINISMTHHLYWAGPRTHWSHNKSVFLGWGKQDRTVWASEDRELVHSQVMEPDPKCTDKHVNVPKGVAEYYNGNKVFLVHKNV